MSGVETGLWLALAVPVVGMGYVLLTWGKRFLQANSKLEYVDDSTHCPCGANRWELLSEEEPTKTNPITRERYRCGHCNKVQVREIPRRGRPAIFMES